MPIYIRLTEKKARTGRKGKKTRRLNIKWGLFVSFDRNKVDYGYLPLVQWI